MEKTKDKVAKAIKDRANARVNDEAHKLKDAVSRFRKAFRIDGESNKKVAVGALRTLADYIEGTEKSWKIPAIIFRNAEDTAFNEFKDQFDALTRFVNRDITYANADIERQEQEEA